MGYWRNCENRKCNKELDAPGQLETLRGQYLCPECGTEQSVDQDDAWEIVADMFERLQAVEEQNEKLKKALIKVTQKVLTGVP